MDLLKELEGAKTIGISGHIRPDGDCIGSVMAIYLFLKKAMPSALVIPMIEKPGEEFSCIKGIDEINTEFKPGIDKFDAYIGLDSSAIDRYGEAIPYFESAKKRIVIDHHVSNEGFGDVSYIDPDASSACELVYDVLDKSYIDVEIAKALYIGIIHDTGIFHYSCTGPKTLKTAGELVAFGFDFSDLIDKTFFEKTRAGNLLLARGVSESVLHEDGRIISTCISLKTQEELGAKKSDADGIVNQNLYTKGVYVSVFFFELKPNEYKISLRSNGQVDVARVSKFFDGGGHVRAAGFSLTGEYEDCLNKVIAKIKEQI